MGRKQDSKSNGQKLIRLYAKLLYSGNEFSLIDLADTFHCSKQTITRLIDDINKFSGTEVQTSTVNRKHYYHIKKSKFLPKAAISETEFLLLQMCRDFTANLLGEELFTEAANTLVKASGKKISESSPFFSSYRPGTIDYTPHHETIHALIDAMKQNKICTISYQAIMETKAKTFDVMPLKLFSRNDTVYLHARRKGRGMEFDPLSAVHRIQKVTVTEALFEYPMDYNFEKAYNQNFGIIKDETFKVKAEFTGWAAGYVSERKWSTDQKIEKVGDNKIILEFTASSEPEVISWLLWFGDEAKLISPETLVKDILDRIDRMRNNYKS